MKINEIIVRERPGTGMNNPGMQSEEWRATEEFKTLKKFSPEFANKFMQKFQQLGRNSVDAAYQAAAEERKMEMEKVGISKTLITQEMTQGREAHAEVYTKFKIKYADTGSIDTATGRRGGQYYNTNASKDLSFKNIMKWAKGFITDISNPVDALKRGLTKTGKGVNDFFGDKGVVVASRNFNKNDNLDK